jgi:hypothetical protein
MVDNHNSQPVPMRVRVFGPHHLWYECSGASFTRGPSATDSTLDVWCNLKVAGLEPYAFVNIIFSQATASKLAKELSGFAGQPKTLHLRSNIMGPHSFQCDCSGASIIEIGGETSLHFRVLACSRGTWISVTLSSEGFKEFARQLQFCAAQTIDVPEDVAIATEERKRTDEHWTSLTLSYLDMLDGVLDSLERRRGSLKGRQRNILDRMKEDQQQAREFVHQGDIHSAWRYCMDAVLTSRLFPTD